MAIIKLGPVISDIRNSIGGVTFSRNRSGAYIKKRTKPTNSVVGRRDQVHAVVRYLQEYWRDTLTAATRIPWTDLASTATVLNGLGEAHHITPINMFVRVNASLKLHGLAILTVPPALPILCDTPKLVTFGAVAGGAGFTSATPVLASASNLFVYVAAPQPQTRNYFKGPYASRFLLDPVSAFPYTLIPGADCTIGDRFFLYTRYQDSVGRLSIPIYQHIDITT